MERHREAGRQFVKINLREDLGNCTRPHVNAWLHLIVPAFLLGGLAISLVGDADLRIASWIYASGGNSWVFKNSWLTQDVIHRGGRMLTLGFGLVILVLSIAAFRSDRLHKIRWPLVRMLVSMLASTVIISLVKRYSSLDCPWDIAQLGGTRPYYTLFDSRPFDEGSSGCFPAGHAGSGYAWLALYFFLLDVRPRWRLLGLVAGVSLGVVFGMAQQIRGAHFLSHDLVSALICWSVAWLIHIRRRENFSQALDDCGRARPPAAST